MKALNIIMCKCFPPAGFVWLSDVVGMYTTAVPSYFEFELIVA